MGAGGGEHDGDYDDGNEDDEDNIDAKSKKSGASRKSKASQGGTEKTVSQPTPRVKDGKSAEEQALNKEHGSSKGDKFRRKNKKLKKYSTNYFMLLVKFFLVISFLESYFLY